jgi:REP element-mobilizing transposase RayT
MPLDVLHNPSLTFVRRPFVVGIALEQIRITARRERFAVLAYCFMPDHVHLFVEGLHEHSDLKRFATVSEQRSGASHALSRGTRLWQEGYWDTILRDGSFRTRQIR